LGTIQGYWTSGQRRAEVCGTDNFVWKTKTGTAISITYKNWATGKPDCANRNEMCLYLTTPMYLHERWDDLNCAWPLRAMCELEL